MTAGTHQTIDGLEGGGGGGGILPKAEDGGSGECLEWMACMYVKSVSCSDLEGDEPKATGASGIFIHHDNSLKIHNQFNLSDEIRKKKLESAGRPMTVDPLNGSKTRAQHAGGESGGWRSVFSRGKAELITNKLNIDLPRSGHMEQITRSASRMLGSKECRQRTASIRQLVRLLAEGDGCLLAPSRGSLHDLDNRA
jgi:hypothetical protein